MNTDSLAPRRTSLTERKTVVPAFLHVLLVSLILGLALSSPLSAQSPNEALFNAVEVNDIDAVEAAIAAGADLAMKNADGMTPADVAVDLGHFRIAHLLLSKRTVKTDASGPRVTANVKEALTKPKSRVAVRAKPMTPDPRLSDLMVPKKPDNVTAMTPATAPAPASPTPATTAPPAKPVQPVQKAAPPEPRPDDEMAQSTPQPMPDKTAGTTAQASPDAEKGFLGSLWDDVKNVVTIGGLLGGDQTKVNADDRRLTSKQGDRLMSPADRFAKEEQEAPQANLAPSDSAAGRMVDRLKGVVGSDNTAENAFGLPQVPVVPPPVNGQIDLATPPGAITVETAERAPPPLAAPSLDQPGTEVPMQIPGLAAPELPAVSTAPGQASNNMASPAAPGIEVPGLPALGVPGLPDGPAPPDPEVPGLPGAADTTGLDIPGVAAPAGEVPGIIPPPTGTADSLPAIPPGLEPLPGSETGALRRPGGLEEPADPTVLPPPGALQDQLSRIDRILNRSPVQNTKRYLTPGELPGGQRNQQPQTGAPQTAPAKAPVERKKAPDAFLEIPKGLDGSRQIRQAPDIVEKRDPAEILRRARESEAVMNERKAQSSKTAKDTANIPRPLSPSGHQLTAPDKAITAREEPSRRMFDRFTNLTNRTKQAEDIHGLPIVRPAINGRNKPIKDVLVSEIPEDKRANADHEISALARFFRGDQEEEAGMKAPKFEVKQEPLPRVIDNMIPENDPARSRVVDDKLLDLRGVELRPSATGTQPGATPTRDTQLDQNFVDKLATVLGPGKAQPQFTNDQPPEPGKVGLKDLNIPKDQQVKPALPSIPDPWTMTVEKNTPQGENQTLGVTAISPVDGSEVHSEKGVVSQMVGRIRKLLSDPKDEDKGPKVETLDEQDRQATAEKLLSEALRDGAPTALPDQGQWPVTEVETLNAPPGVPPKPRPGVLTRTSLEDVVLSMGESVTLENTLPPQQDGIDPLNSCVKKNRGTTLFCVEPIDWPESIRSAFIVPTILYTGPSAITRYDQGTPTRLHALFDSEQFEKVIAYYQARYGEPTEIWKRSIAPLAKPRMDNPTVTWRSRDSRTNVITVLEIRKFDDSRGGFPDTNRGAVMLYHLNAPSIFPQVSSHELMRLRRSSR